MAGASRYRGRFAPTPSGPLHYGSLLTALAGWLDARAAGGEWRLRIDDLDRGRSREEHVTTIGQQLQAFGLHWDGPLVRQTGHEAAYRDALQRLVRDGRVYRCDCTRARLAAESRPGPDGPVYSGRCRDRALTAEAGSALRVRVDDGVIALDDPWQGRSVRDLPGEVGDFVVARSDGTIGYQLACCVDEALLGITDVVRGADLLGSSLRQRWLCGVLGIAAPICKHIPVALDAQGRKLSKQNHAPALAPDAAVALLRQALRALGQTLDPLPEPEVAEVSPHALLQQAVQHWQPAQLPRGATLTG